MYNAQKIASDPIGSHRANILSREDDYGTNSLIGF